MSANWKYRQYLTKNADAIITENQTFKCTEQPTYPKTTHSTNTPFLYSSCVDTAQPVSITSNEKKIGGFVIGLFSFYRIRMDVHDTLVR